MSFLQPCFIAKNNQCMRDRLAELGYRFSPQMRKNPTKYPYIATSDGCVLGVPDNYPRTLLCRIEEYGRKLIDCGDNEDMFFALAALRDDTNKYQWFIALDTMYDENYHGEINVYYEKGDWLLWDYYSFVEDMPSDFRKATTKEIIEHFNK